MNSIKAALAAAGLIILVLIGAPALSPAPPGPALILIESAPPANLNELLASGVAVLRDFGEGWIAAGDSGDIAAIERLGLRYRILDPSIRDETYFTAWSRDEAGWEFAESRADILAREGPHAVLRASPETAEALAGRGIEIARVFLSPMRPHRAVSPERAAPWTQADERIEEMVGAVSIANINASVQRLQDFTTRHSRHDSCRAAGDWIESRFESFGIDSVYLREWDSEHSPNVVAVLPGAGHPDKMVIIGGHYDSITANPDYAPGADDNASGTACVLECARILSQYEFDYTIIFVAFSGEEMGLLGSEAYAAAAASREDDIVGMIAVDMIGYVAPGDAVDLDIIDNPHSAWMRDRVIQAASLYVPDFSVVHGSLTTGSSDHASFWRNGYDAIMFFEDSGSYSPYIHTANDVIGVSYINHDLAEGAVKTAVAAVADLARPFRVAIAHAPLSHTADETNPYRVAARIVSDWPLDASSLALWYRTDAVWNSLALLPSGAPDEYEAWIPPQPGGSAVNYYLAAANVDGVEAVEPETAPAEPHVFAVGTAAVAFEDDFETDKGWTVGAPGDDATQGLWERGDPNTTYTSTAGGIVVQPEDDHTPDPGVSCFFTGNSPPGSLHAQNDVDDGKTTLLSPVIDLSNCTNAWVSYYRWYTNDTGPAPASDTLTVDVSPDGGLTWYRLETTHLTDRSWHFVEHDLLRAIPLTAEVRFRVIASDEDPGSIVEAAVDDFTIVTYRGDTTSIDDLPAIAALRLHQNFPNPFNPETAIRFDVPAPGEIVSLKIYDVAGRAVGTLLENERVTGTRVLRWNGRDGTGREVPSGVYFYRLEAGGRSLSKKLVVLR